MTKGFFRTKAAGRGFKWLTVMCIAAVILAAMLPLGALAASNGTQAYIGEAKAKSIALESAGISEGQATFLRVHLDHEDGYVVYDVAFYSGNTEYDYEISATDGRILEQDQDIEYYSIPSKSSATTQAGTYIGEAAAKTAALNHAGVSESQVTFIKAYLDDDDRHIVYDVEFYSGNTEYDYEIDAVSGEIYEFDREIEYYSIPRNAGSSGGTPSASTDTTGYIGEAKAKSAALNHAGVSESQATSIRVHLDRDDGRVDYDVEFYVGNTEYEYEIDAVNGSILEYDRETKRSAPRSNTGIPAPSMRPAATSGTIGEAKAKSIALSDAGVSESQVRRLRVKLDRDDGRTIYEVDFRKGLMEYEYEIDAVSGAILESDAEYDD